MAQQYIFTMQNLRKVVPPQREILKGIYLSFYPGAKIGVLGLNGAGKSTLLKIMAGVEKEFTGEANPAEGIRRAYLAQDPYLDPKKTVLENVEEAVAPVKGATGADTPADARAAVMAQGKRWVEAAGGGLAPTLTDGVEVTPATSYAGEGLEGVVGGAVVEAATI